MQFIRVGVPIDGWEDLLGFDAVCDVAFFIDAATEIAEASSFDRSSRNKS
jgi:hypothetical protein